MRKLLMLLMLMVLIISSVVYADPDEDYPTAQALEDTIIPLNDPVDLAQRLLRVAEIGGPLTNPPRYGGGERETFYVSGEDGAFTIDATLKVIGQHVYMWVEDGEDLPLSELQSLANAWDTRIYERVRELWGSESNPGIDGDPRVHVLFADNLQSSTAAYFARQHTFPDEVMPHSNEREMFVVHIDAFDSFSGPYIEGVFSHEFQHMIRDNIDANEDTWLNEAFSTFTELYLEFDSSDWFADSFLAMPDTQLNTFGESGDNRAMNYGAGFMFVTYLFERYGIEGVHTLSLDPANGLYSFDNTLRGLGEVGGVDEFFADWVLANWIQDTSVANGHYGYEMLNPTQRPPEEDIFAYPRTRERRVNQYATDYYLLNNLNGIASVGITFDMPVEVALIPANAYSGQMMWYSNRADGSNARLTREFDLSGVTSAELSFMTWYEIEEDWDYVYLTISADGGQTWDMLSTPQMRDSDPYGNNYGFAYTGESGGWIEQRVNLDAYTGNPVLIRFDLVTDDAVNLPGLAVDDIAIESIGYFSDLEADGGGWVSEGWLLMDNVLPQRAWLQAVQFTPNNDVVVKRWLLPDDNLHLQLEDGVDRVLLTISPFAPTTTVPMDYTFTVIVE